MESDNRTLGAATPATRLPAVKGMAVAEGVLRTGCSVVVSGASEVVSDNGTSPLSSSALRGVGDARRASRRGWELGLCMCLTLELASTARARG